MPNTKKGGAQDLAIVIMAAGKGTRLKSKRAKVLHQIGGKPLLAHVIAAATQVVPAESVYCIVGHQADDVRAAVQSTGVRFIVQDPQNGTGGAIKCAREHVQQYQTILVLSGDVPLIQPAAISRLRDFHASRKAAMTILTAEPDDLASYGRIVRVSRSSDDVKAIVEHKALSKQQEKIREINSSIYAFATKPLFSNINRLTTNNVHGEYYLTDMAAILMKSGARVVALKAAASAEVLGANTLAEVANLDASLRARKASELMAAGVSIYRPETCVIDSDVQIAADTVIEPYVQILGRTCIGADCHIRSFSIIRDSQIGDNVQVRPGCIIDQSQIASGAVIGPYSHIRPGTNVGSGAHIGNFVEVKKTRVGRGSKANHLTYLGDAEIGDNVNIGAGTITCNYDGENKNVTVIEDGAFIGSDSTLVAPVRIGKGSYVAAGSTITDNVPPDALALGRARQTVKEAWANQKRNKKKPAAD